MARAGAEFRCYPRGMAKLLQAMADGFGHFPKAFGMGVVRGRHNEHGKFHAFLLP
jgi:hypothetical protein